MIRTLLHAALYQAPELWSTLLLYNFADPWKEPITVDDVKRTFQLLIEGVGNDYKLFSFIDGLDDLGGSLEVLTEMIKSLISLTSRHAFLTECSQYLRMDSNDDQVCDPRL